MSARDHIVSARAALASLEGLTAPPLTATKKALLLQRLDSAAAAIGDAVKAVEAQAVEAPFIPVKESPTVALFAVARAKRRPK